MDIPATLDEAFSRLKEIAGNPKELLLFAANGSALYHHGVGRWIRNNWGLRKQEGPLYRYLYDLGLRHADDMSGLILKSFERHLRGEPLEIEQQVQHYHAHWEKQGLNPFDV